jgi:hypothetical protein
MRVLLLILLIAGCDTHNKTVNAPETEDSKIFCVDHGWKWSRCEMPDGAVCWSYTTRSGNSASAGLSCFKGEKK